MKKTSSLLLLSFVFISNIYSQCNPDLKEIYSFDIGDIFQYVTEINDWSTGTGVPQTRLIYEKKIISEKSISNDSIYYIIDCMYYSYFEAPNNAPYDKYDEYSASFKDTLLIIDSTSHYLNACDSELVYIGLENDFYSFIITNEIKEKKVGGDENLYQYDSNDSLILVSPGFQYEQIFAEGVGLKYQKEYFFEYSTDIELQGYVKNGDTTGIVWNDQDFLVSIQVSHIANQISVYPRLIPDNGIVNIETDIAYKDIKMFSIGGKLQDIEKIGQSQIKINNLIPGIYILTIIFDDNMITKKIIKQ